MKYLLFCTLIFLCASSIAQHNEQHDTAITKIYADTLKSIQQHGLRKNSSNRLYLVKIKEGFEVIFKKQFKPQIKRQLNKNWFIIEADENLIMQNEFIEKYFFANNFWKLSAALLYNKSKLNFNKDYIFLIETSNAIALEDFLDKHKTEATILTKHGQKLFRIKTSIPFIIKKLINEKEVISVDIKLNSPKEESVVNDYDNSVNGINLFFTKYSTVNGNGLTVSVKENLFDTTDIDFQNRYSSTTLSSNEITTHATTMATLIGGGGNSFYTGKGIAWGCNLSSDDFTVLLPETDSVYKHYNISVQNHSYGVGIENFYGSDAGAYDQSMIDDTTLLHIFSSGNSGNLTDTIGQYKNLTGFANITGSFKQAKNILIVGSVDSFYNVPLLSSKGPSYDGRIKPELVAYGNEGSSGAAAITSGSALAVQSAYSMQHHDSLPANTLVKAILINSADDVFNPGPDFYSGYGNVNTYHAVKDMLSNNFFYGIVAPDETKNFNISLPANAKNLKITLVWNDPPAQTNAYTALVNDLDLQLEKVSDHEIWLPWVLSSIPNVDSLNQPAKRKRDSLNVVEQITIDDPAEGNYIIHVKGYDVSISAQSFYVVYRYDTANTFEFVSPAKNDHFNSGGNSIFRWNSTYTSTPGKLEYSLDKGATWNLINANADLSKKYFKWIAPDTFCLALARMTIGNDVYVSDTFNFSTQLYPQVGFNCNDSVLIYWNKANGINNYKIYQLGSKYLEPISATTDTNIILHNTTSPYIAVTTAFDNNENGVNSYTFNYTTQGVACYVSNFLADLNASNHALLQLSLGTTYGVTTVQFQELTANGWKNISTIATVTNTEFNYEDDTLHNGINNYRAAITLDNGKIIYSNTASVFYFGNDTFVMVPNPVPSGHKLTILSNNSDSSTMVIYDLAGRKVLQQTITETREDIPVAHLARGMYIVVIYNNSKKLFTGKLLAE